MIHITHLSKEFTPGTPVVDEISLHVKAGEVFGFLGPNGAGKTTTIKIMTTLLHPSSGSVKIAGHDVTKDPLSVRMSFGYVGQQSGVDPAMTISENLILQGRLYHLPLKVIKERIRVLLELFDMSHREGQWVGALSGGLKRRLDIATSLLHKPRLLFLDEPTLGLDPKSRTDLWGYLRKLNEEEGMTLFLTSHYLDEVDQLAHRVGILDSGRIRAIGTPDELKDSLGVDTIHLTFKKALEKEQLTLLQSKPAFGQVIQQGDALRLYLDSGRQTLPKVVQFLDEHHLSPLSVLLTRPSFDDVYLKYTGKDWSLADQQSSIEGDGWGGASDAKKWKNKWNKGDNTSGNDWEQWDKDESQTDGNREAQWKNQGDTDQKASTKTSVTKESDHEEVSQTVQETTVEENDDKEWGNQWQKKAQSSENEWPDQWQEKEAQPDKKKWPSDEDGPSRNQW